MPSLTQSHKIINCTGISTKSGYSGMIIDRPSPKTFFINCSGYCNTLFDEGATAYGIEVNRSLNSYFFPDLENAYYMGNLMNCVGISSQGSGIYARNTRLIGCVSKYDYNGRGNYYDYDHWAYEVSGYTSLQNCSINIGSQPGSKYNQNNGILITPYLADQNRISISNCNIRTEASYAISVSGGDYLHLTIDNSVLSSKGSTINFSFSDYNEIKITNSKIISNGFTIPTNSTLYFNNNVMTKDEYTGGNFAISNSNGNTKEHYITNNIFFGATGPTDLLIGVTANNDTKGNIFYNQFSPINYRIVYKTSTSGGTSSTSNIQYRINDGPWLNTSSVFSNFGSSVYSSPVANFFAYPGDKISYRFNTSGGVGYVYGTGLSGGFTGAFGDEYVQLGNAQAGGIWNIYFNISSSLFGGINTFVLTP